MIVKQTRQTSIARLLKEITKNPPSDTHLTYRQLVNLFGEQALGLMTILFALPTALPLSVIPGVSFIFALPVLFISLHLILGKQALWLPKFLARRTIATPKLLLVIHKTLPYLIYAERYLKPRWWFFSQPVMERLHGVILLFLALLLLLPIPLSNFIFSVLIILFGLGIAEKDGVFLVLAYLGFFLYVFFLTTLTRGIIALFSF
ncbi:exopolysaccharide biosynthesis protein [Legionella spiritensis]|uniref:Proton transporter n=1 Tax=Legionella spiritensis TaxID=452 RepID=A0A0W0YWL8_LEGSP|nr:exopolysaccharide biosynthesis protein [Legionella spiritensis]KTD61250.1 proton transporter [Legionella spiritensis]SNV23598.1 ABC transporter permease [Legionella spiritensis]VEG91614.1 ABC transporter permease [Legionella spiritensis]